MVNGTAIPDGLRQRAKAIYALAATSCIWALIPVAIRWLGYDVSIAIMIACAGWLPLILLAVLIRRSFQWPLKRNDALFFVYAYPNAAIPKTYAKALRIMEEHPC